LINLPPYFCQKSTMNKLYPLGFALLAAITLFNCTGSSEQKEVVQNQDSLLQVQKDSLLDLFKSELESIASKVNEVSTSNGIFKLDTSENVLLSKETIIDQVESLDNLLEANQKQLADLYARMKDSKVANEKLEGRISGMLDRIAQKEEQVSELMKLLANKDIQIDEILSTMDSMRVNNIELTEEVIKMDEELHSVYYTVGDAKELKKNGVVTKEGGILGVGSSKKLDVSKLDRSLFKEVDQRDLISIPLYSKKAKVITNHPESSYEFVLDQNETVESIKILDRKAFWEVTDYLVVEVSN